MYSLIGLYDLAETLRDKGHDFEVAKGLFEAGLDSLRRLLPLFDTGSGSVYDLRHFTMPGSEPKVARWDYHSTHINLLYLLSTIDGDSESLLLETADRWRNYMIGKYAKHN